VRSRRGWIESLEHAFHRAMRRTHLPIADPCHEDWDAMDPVERGRFCRSCDKQVYDLSSMTEHEARGVLQEHAGENLCVRYCHDSAGNIRFRTRPARVAALALAMAACTPHDPPQERQQVVGELVVEPHVEVMGAAPFEPEIEETLEVEMGDVPAPEVEEESEPPRPLMGKPAIRDLQQAGSTAVRSSRTNR
jgi:hypothetical protein